MNTSSKLKSALFVVGGSLAAAPASALELGDVKVHSTLGQPLRASIAYALAPNETMSDTCVSLQPMMGAGGLPSIDRGSLIVTDGVIAITGSSIIREPLVSMRVSINCQYTPRLTREYMMFVDPMDAPVIEAPTPERVATQPQLDAQPVVRRAPVTARARNVISEPIAEATRFQVPSGATLGGIAEKVENRPVGVWKTANLIFDMNPDAFIDNDPNKLKAGSWLMIPSFSADAPATVADAAPPVEVEPVAAPADSTAYEPVSTPVDAEATEPEAQSSDAPLASLQPGDVVTDANNPYVTPAESTSTETIVIPDTQLEGPQTTSTSPNVPVAVIRQTTPSESSSTSWLWWLGGGSVAVILGLILFGRRFRGGFGSTPVAPAAPHRGASDDDTQNLEATSDIEVEIADETEAIENLAIDADLVVGTGLQQGTEVDVAQDFGFAAPTDLDLELPEEMSSGAASSETDVLPSLRTDEHSILESEVMPDDDDYDMSVIVDATKMPRPDEATQPDLAAIQVDDGDETLITGDYTVSQEVDYKIVEQDYEDEMTATQALNAEILKAADDLTVSLDTADLASDGTSEMPLASDATSEMPLASDATSEMPLASDATSEMPLASDATSEMPLATVHELDVTTLMPVRDEQDIGDDDDTGVNPTINVEAEDETVNLGDDNTIEVPKAKDGKKTG